ncbi:MAG: helix-turn-helix domain-containing protein [Clostridiales bacterium]|jgi:transcriptional regulator with XRE-family HTH domain|nr:helix-turn-helix domain-containing protein [Clostridiales bacterium]
MTFGEKLKIAREKQFLSQEAMAKELGVSFSTVNRWENGKIEPNYAAKKAFHEFCLKHNIKFKGDDE